MEDYPQQLADAAADVVEPWLVRCVVDTARRLTGSASEALLHDATAMAATRTAPVLAALDELLETDVDLQRTNPLSILRDAVRYPTAVLRQHDVPTARRDGFDARAFPDDLYALGPATWSDVDASLVEPGLIWGAWKAKTVLDRRRHPPPAPTSSGGALSPPDPIGGPASPAPADS